MPVDAVVFNKGYSKEEVVHLLGLFFSSGLINIWCPSEFLGHQGSLPVIEGRQVQHCGSMELCGTEKEDTLTGYIQRRFGSFHGIC